MENQLSVNKELRRAFAANRWSELEGFLQYLRKCKCFTHMSNDEHDANPYWWGVVLEFARFEEELHSLLKNNSIKPRKLRELLTLCSEDSNGPIVRLTGLTGLRILDKWTGRIAA